MDADIPTIPKIQELLVQMEDKTKAFIGSRDWIGSYEVCLIVDKIFDIPCKILHVPKGNLLADHLPTLIQHFEKFGSPIMMGGDIDASSKGIFGVAQDKNDSFYLLVIDQEILFHGLFVLGIWDRPLHYRSRFELSKYLCLGPKSAYNTL